MRSRLILSLILAFVMASLGLIAPSAADGIIIVDPPPDVGPVRLDESLAIKYHRVEVTVTNQIATTRVDQVFVNDNPWAAEGTYIFPLPEGAAVSDFVMWVDGEAVSGEILEANEARAIYNEYVRNMQDPALLEYVDRRALKASVFPIPPGDERRIELEYSQILPVDNGLVHYSYPLSTEKYSSRPLEEVTIGIEVESRDPIKAVYSSSHKVFIEREDDFHALLGFEEFDVLPDRDFEFYYSISSEDVGLNLLSYKEPGEDGFFLLLAAPNVEVEEGEVVAKDVILVLDVSGSMEGEKLGQAKDAAQYILNNLNLKDRFNVIAFSTGVTTFSDELEPASKSKDGVEFVDRLESLGGTDINRALLTAMDLADPSKPTTLIFLTDGLATQGVEDTPTILENVGDAAPENLRLFSFGVGDDVDTDLLDQLSLDHGGMTAYVRPGERIDEKVSALYRKISKPVLSNVEIDFGKIKADQIYPEDVPDLFAGSQLVLVGRYREGATTTITLSGKVNDQEESFAYQAEFEEAGGDEFIPRLWATRAIGSYLREVRLRGEDPELVDAVVKLSIRYGIITPYTSFLIEEDGDDIFTEEGREAISKDVDEVVAKKAFEPSYGETAVEEAVFEAELAQTEAAPSMSIFKSFRKGSDGGAGGGTTAPGSIEPLNEVEPEEVIKNMGSKTFVLRNDTWIDTTFDQSKMAPVKVGFLTDTYFDLILAYPDLGDYFSLGEQVIVVYEGTAYEVVEGEGDTHSFDSGLDSLGAIDPGKIDSENDTIKNNTTSEMGGPKSPSSPPFVVIISPLISAHPIPWIPI